jgi:VanZ family protein
MPMVININRKILTLICLSIILLIGLAGLWPADFNPPNGVEWLAAEPGVRFSGQGHLYSSADLGNCFANREITLEIVLRPSREPYDRVGRVFTLWDQDGQEILVGVQWRDGLGLQARSPQNWTLKGYQNRGEKNLLIKGQKVMVTLTSDSRGTTLYKDGLPVAVFPGYPLLGVFRNNRQVFIWGNSAIGKNGWKGEILGLALYNRVLSDKETKQHYSFWIQRDFKSLRKKAGLIGLYPFLDGKGERVRNLAGDSYPLFKPTFFHPLQKVVLAWPSREHLTRLRLYQDLAVNILGFIPLGFFFVLWLLRFAHLSFLPAGIVTLVLGSGISLGIELTQVYLPSRNSQASDLVFNILGTLVGLALLGWALKRKPGPVVVGVRQV